MIAFDVVEQALQDDRVRTAWRRLTRHNRIALRNNAELGSIVADMRADFAELRAGSQGNGPAARTLGALIREARVALDECGAPPSWWQGVRLWLGAWIAGTAMD